MSQDGPYPGLKGHFPGETEEVLPTLVAKLVAGGALTAPDAGLLAKLGASASAAPAPAAKPAPAPVAAAAAPVAAAPAPKPAAPVAAAAAPAPAAAAGSSQRTDPTFKPADVDQALSGIFAGKEDSQLRAAVAAPSPLSDRISARLGSVPADASAPAAAPAPVAAPVAPAPAPVAAKPAPPPVPAPAPTPVAEVEEDEDEPVHAGDRIGNRIVTRVDQTLSVSSLEEVLSGMETPKPGGSGKGDLSGDWFGDFGKKPSTGSTFDNLMDSVSGAFTDTPAAPAEAAPPPPPPAPKPVAVAPPPAPALPPVAPMAATTVAPAAAPAPQLDDAGLDSLLEGIVPAAKPSRPVPTKKQAQRLYQRVIELTDEQLLDAADELLLDVVEDLELAKHPVPPKLKKRVEEIKLSHIGDASKPAPASHASLPEETDHDEVIVVEPSDAVFGPPPPAAKPAPAPAPAPKAPEPPKPVAATATAAPAPKPVEAPKPTVTVQQPAPPVAPTKTEAPKPAAPAPQKPAAPVAKVTEAPVPASPAAKVVDTKFSATKTLAPSPEAVYDETIEKAKDAGDRRTLVLSREEMDKRGKQLVGAAETPKYQIVIGYLGITLAVVSGLVYLLFVLYTGKY